MSLSKLSASLVDASLEIQPALANISFDFSLWKVAAPREFEGVGAALTTHRRNEAENGTAHSTARKLGALFDRLLPTTPNLIKAYGQRASEIAQASSIDTEALRAYGVFANGAGTDATSLWAAATSGSGAISIHLLACMLARIWDQAEATAIWKEIIDQRKRKIIDDFEQSNVAEIATLGAAKQDITHENITEWDASARAWLRAADQVKFRQQRQLDLILDNIEAPVNRFSDTYDSVINAWINALTQMEALINGISQKATAGDILLALKAWHLYPDLMLVIPRTTAVQQHDSIFCRGAVLTIGLGTPTNQSEGIHWSLPLAHLRYYGAPVVSSKSIHTSERSNISCGELLQATLGCVIQGWNDAGNDVRAVLVWLDQLLCILEQAAHDGVEEATELIHGEASYSWFNLLLTAARAYIQSTEEEQKAAWKLIQLGIKHGKKFLGLPNTLLFGLLNGNSTFSLDTQKVQSLQNFTIDLTNYTSQHINVIKTLPGSYISLVASEEDQIASLRRIAEDLAQKIHILPEDIFIRYKHHYPSLGISVFEYATALPVRRDGTKRSYDQQEKQSQGHKRWLYSMISSDNAGLADMGASLDASQVSSSPVLSGQTAYSIESGLLSYGLVRAPEMVDDNSSDFGGFEIPVNTTNPFVSYYSPLPSIRASLENPDGIFPNIDWEMNGPVAIPRSLRSDRDHMNDDLPKETAAELHMLGITQSYHSPKPASPPQVPFKQGLRNSNQPWPGITGEHRGVTNEEAKAVRRDFEDRRRLFLSIGEDIETRESQLINETVIGTRPQISWTVENGSRRKIYHSRSVYGDIDSAGLFLHERVPNLVEINRPTSLEASDFFELFASGKMDPALVAKKLSRLFWTIPVDSDPYIKSLKAVSTAAAVYKRFQHAYVDVRILQQPLFRAAWVQSCRTTELSSIPNALRPYKLSRTGAFSCVAMFESGKYDIDPKLLENVMAMSTGDSIYVGEALLVDPFEKLTEEHIKRVQGNIGRPGMAFLVPPLDPMIREASPSDWNRINRTPFDGVIKDCFDSTSLHLSFTGAHTALNVGFSGGQYVEVYLLETLIQVCEGGNWVADLDVLKAFKSQHLYRLGGCQDNSHQCSGLNPPMTMIDNWFELIDHPEHAFSIVRAHRNWQARLAAATISIAMGYETLVVSGSFCSDRLGELARRKGWGNLNKVILIS